MTTNYVGIGGYCVSDAAVRASFGIKYTDFLDKLTLISPQKIGPPKVATCYKRATRNKEQVLLLPRGLIPKLAPVFGPPKVYFNDRPIGDCELTGELFPNQKIVCDHIMDNVFTPARANAGTASCIMVLEAGLGKTFTLGGLLPLIRQKTLFIAATKHLAAQAILDLRGFTDLTIAAYNSKKPACDADVTVIVINSAMRCDHQFFEQFGFICFDEVQTLCGEKRREIFWRASSKYLMAMSATIDHNRFGFDEIYKKHLGEIVRTDQLPGFNTAAERFNAVVEVINYYGNDEFTKDIMLPATGKLFTPDMIKQFAADPQRNELIIRKAIELYNDPQNNIYLFCEGRNHADYLAAEIAKRLGAAAIGKDIDDNEIIQVDAPNIVVLKGNINNDDKATAMTSRIIPTTFGYSSFGVSITKMNCIIFCTPRKSNYEQITRRICRKGSDMTITRKFIDIVDAKTMMRHQFRSRLAVYKHFGWTVKYIGKEIAEVDEVGEADAEFND